MPDIQTEMQKILQSWEQPETTEQPKETTVFKPTNNVTRSTFESVRDNPGLPKGDYIRRLEAMGFKKASTSSLLSQMVRQGQIWVGSDGALRPNAKDYTPIKSAKTMANKEKKAAKPTKTLKLKTSKADASPVPVSAGLAALVDERIERDEVKHIMNTISLPDAKRLYNALATYFGTV
jgi:endo-1,4-beta-D-glucanase Y